ncbi:MAG: hypothetical protein QXE05_10150 [Nitrososphaeria archaeon]
MNTIVAKTANELIAIIIVVVVSLPPSDLGLLMCMMLVGMFYLFYGEESVLDTIVHMLIVNCVLEREKGGFESKGIYFNNTNYYEGRTVLDSSLLEEISKKAGVDPKTVLENFYTVVAYNGERQLTVAKKVCDLIRDDSGIRLLIAHNLTVFLFFYQQAMARFHQGRCFLMVN